MSRITLAKYYKLNGIRYRKPHFKYFSDKPPELQLLEQQIFVSRLTNFMKLGKSVLFFDETSTNLWDKGEKTWYNPDSPIL